MTLRLKIQIISLFCLFSVVSYGQNQVEIYRIASTMYGAEQKTYNVNVLRLYNDGNYELQRQEYYSKKEMKKNIILEFKKEVGIWTKENDILSLQSKSSGRETKFAILNNSIALLIEGKEVSTSRWKKIKI